MDPSSAAVSGVDGGAAAAPAAVLGASDPHASEVAAGAMAGAGAGPDSVVEGATAGKRRRHDDASPMSAADLKHELTALLDPMEKQTIVSIFMQLAQTNPDVLSAIKAEANKGTEHRKLFVRGLSWDTNEANLRAAFEKFGTVEEAAVIPDKQTGRSKGYGFVTFASMDGAAAALMDPAKEIDGRTTHCNLASKPSNESKSNQFAAGHGHAGAAVPMAAAAAAGAFGGAAGVGGGFGGAAMGGMGAYGGMGMAGATPGAAFGSRSTSSGPSIGDKKFRKLFLWGLSWSTTSDTLTRFFSEFGEIEEGVVAWDRSTGKSKGYGFITFRTPDSAALAVANPHKFIDGRQVNAAYADKSVTAGAGVAGGMAGVGGAGGAAGVGGMAAPGAAGAMGAMGGMGAGGMMGGMRMMPGMAGMAGMAGMMGAPQGFQGQQQ